MMESGAHVSLKQYCDAKDVIVNTHGRLLRILCNDCDVVETHHLMSHNNAYGGDLSLTKEVSGYLKLICIWLRIFLFLM